MRDSGRYLKLGLFVAVGLALAAGGAVYLGGASLFREAVPFDTWVGESVQGLDVGSPVKLLGVAVGRISEVRLAPGGRGEPRVRLRGRLHLDALPAAWRERPLDRLREQVRAGLRARLTSVGLSGQLYLELEDVPDAPPPAEAAASDVVTIPSVPSLGDRLVDSADRIVPRLERVLEALAPAVERAGAAAASLPSVLARLEELLVSLNRLSSGQGAELGRSIENIRALTEDLRRLAERAERDPGGTLFGGPPAPVEPGRRR